MDILSNVAVVRNLIFISKAFFLFSILLDVSFVFKYLKDQISQKELFLTIFQAKCVNKYFYWICTKCQIECGQCQNTRT